MKHKEQRETAEHSWTQEGTEENRKILSYQHIVAAVVHGLAPFGAFRSLAAQVSESVFLWTVSLDGGVTVGGKRGEG